MHVQNSPIENNKRDITQWGKLYRQTRWSNISGISQMWMLLFRTPHSTVSCQFLPTVLVTVDRTIVRCNHGNLLLKIFSFINDFEMHQWCCPVHHIYEVSFHFCPSDFSSRVGFCTHENDRDAYWHEQSTWLEYYWWICLLSLPKALQQQWRPIYRWTEQSPN